MSNAILYIVMCGALLLASYYERETVRLTREVALAYSSGVTEGARIQALKPCTWERVFGR